MSSSASSCERWAVDSAAGGGGASDRVKNQEAMLDRILVPINDKLATVVAW